MFAQPALAPNHAPALSVPLSSRSGNQSAGSRWGAASTADNGRLLGTGGMPAERQEVLQDLRLCPARCPAPGLEELRAREGLSRIGALCPRANHVAPVSLLHTGRGRAF